MAKRRTATEMMVPQAPDYSQLVGEISELLDRARRSAARTVNSILTAMLARGQKPKPEDAVSVQCSDKHDAVVKYALGGINARVFASKYLTNLPDEETLRREIQTAQRALETRAAGRIEAHEESR